MEPIPTQLRWRSEPELRHHRRSVESRRIHNSDDGQVAPDAVEHRHAQLSFAAGIRSLLRDHRRRNQLLRSGIAHRSATTPIEVTQDDEDYYLTDAFGDSCAQSSSTTQRRKESHSFLYAAFTAGHWPLMAPEETHREIQRPLCRRMGCVAHNAACKTTCDGNCSAANGD